MKSLLITICLGVMVLPGLYCARGSEPRILLHQTNMDRGGGTNQWWLPQTRLMRLPQWHPSNAAGPPLSIKNALRAARKWLAVKGSGDGNIEEIVLRPVDPNEAPQCFVFYYRIRFGITPFGNQITCIVLMDGTVLEPELWKNHLTVTAPEHQTKSTTATEVEVVVYEHLIRHVLKEPTNSVLFISATDNEYHELSSIFPNCKLRSAAAAEIADGRKVRDKATKEDGVILAVHWVNFDGEKAKACGGYFAGAGVTFEFDLKKSNTWSILKVSDATVTE